LKESLKSFIEEITSEESEILLSILSTCYEKKGEDIILMDIRDLAPSITDFFIIATGSTVEHIRGMADIIVERAESAGGKLNHIEGYEKSRWVLLDFTDIIVHLMDKESRDYYALELLWADAPSFKYPEGFYK